MLDLILLHPPSIYDFRKRSIMWGPISDVIPSTPIFEMYPLGFVSISQYLTRHGYDVRIINIAYKMLSNPNYDAEREIRNLRASAFGIDLHWLPHAQGSLELARIVKKHHPETPVIFGGLSSTYFHQELITHPQVDFVLRGDSTEVPLLQLLSALKNGTSFDEIPNLTYKENGEVKINPTSWVPDDLNQYPLDYSHIIRAAIKHKDLSGYMPFFGWQEYPITAIFTCRGCTYHCGTCGGSQETYGQFSDRLKPAYREPELVVSDLLGIARYFKGPIFILGDIFQPGREYAEKLLCLLRKQRLDNHVVLEFFDIPPLDSLEMIATSIPRWNIQLSPETHDPAIRKAFGRPYDNQQMEAMIEKTLKLGCNKLDLFFMVGIPGQDAKSVMETIDYIDRLLERFGKSKRLFPYVSPLAPFLDPGSQVFENPEKYGYTLLYHTLEEHRRALLAPSWKQMLNYETIWMSRDKIVESTYQSALKLNQIKLKRGLVSRKKFSEIEKRIGQSLAVIRAIDERIEKGNLTDAPSSAGTLQMSTICDKDELRWPVRVFRFDVRRGSLRILSLLRIKNILKLILWGDRLRGKPSALRRKI
ncbi:MAG: TIGR04190 family B12-binding domain/radical SAM domain protein [Candidatus Zixiibacteriota bacterium]